MRSGSTIFPFYVFVPLTFRTGKSLITGVTGRAAGSMTRVRQILILMFRRPSRAFLVSLFRILSLGFSYFFFISTHMWRKIYRKGGKYRKKNTFSMVALPYSPCYRSPSISDISPKILLCSALKNLVVHEPLTSDFFLLPWCSLSIFQPFLAARWELWFRQEDKEYYCHRILYVSLSFSNDLPKLLYPPPTVISRGSYTYTITRLWKF